METHLTIILICFAPGIFWLGFFFQRAKYDHIGDKVLVAMFMAGLVAGPIALGLFYLLQQVPFYKDLTQLHLVEDNAVRFAYCVFGIGPVEELSKFLVVWTIMYRREEFSSAIDGLTFAAAAALGFASIENWYFLENAPESLLDDGDIVLASGVVLPFVHMLFSSFWGVGLSFSKFTTAPQSNRVLLTGLVLASVFHGLYDYITLSHTVPGVLLIPLVLVLWIWLVVAMRRLALQRPLRDAFDLTQSSTQDPQEVTSRTGETKPGA